MLNWICPDCGRECSSASRECPGCVEDSRVSEQATPVPTGVLALAQGIEGERATGLMSAGGETAHALHVDGNEESIQSTSLLVEDPTEAKEPSEQTLNAFVENLEEQVSSQLAIAETIENTPEPEISQQLEQFAAPEAVPVAEQDGPSHDRAIDAIVGSFRQQPETLLLAAPARDERHSAPPVTTFFALDRPFAAHPSYESNRLPVAAPQPTLLPGPCLPPDLRNLRPNAGRAALGRSRKLKLPAWVISLLVAMLLVLVAGSVLQNVNASHDSKPASVSTDTAAQSPVTPESVPSDAHPFGRYVEVTGVRVVADPQRRSQLQYLVVNHSNIQITGIALHISVRSADPASKAPLIQVSAVIPSLGAYESKEIRTDLDTQIRSTEIPDWDHLKVDLQVTSR